MSLDYFFTRTFRAIKYGISIIGGLACGVIIVTGGLGMTTIVIPICGGIALLPMGFIFFETTKVIRDMENLVVTLKGEITDLSESIDKLELTNDKLETTTDELVTVKQSLVDRTKELEKMLSKATKEMDELNETVKRYQIIENNLKNSVDQSEKNNLALQETANQLLQARNKYMEQNEKLKKDIELIQSQLKEIIKLKVQYELEIETLSKNNSELANTTTNLQNQLQHTEKLYNDARTAVKSLLIVSGVLKDLGNDMIRVEKKTEENVSTLTKIMNLFGKTRSDKLFEKLDSNKDGVLDKDEFLDIIMELED